MSEFLPLFLNLTDETSCSSAAVVCRGQAAAVARGRAPGFASWRPRSRMPSGPPMYSSHSGRLPRPISTARGSSMRRPRRRRIVRSPSGRAEARIRQRGRRPSQCHGVLSGVVRRDGVTVAISTSGHAPALTALLREALDAILPPDLATWVSTGARRARRVAS